MTTANCKYCGAPVSDWQAHFEQVHNLVELNARVDELRLVIQESIQLMDGEGTGEAEARRKLTAGLGLEYRRESQHSPKSYTSRLRCMFDSLTAT